VEVNYWIKKIHLEWQWDFSNEKKFCEEQKLIGMQKK